MRVESAVQAPVIEVRLGGLASADSADRVRARLQTLTRYAPRPIVRATIRFSTPTGDARTIVVAHATLSMRGTRLTAFGAGTTVGEATERARTTLRRQLLDLAHRHRRHVPAADPSTSDEKFAVIRHVTRMPACASREQAVLELEQLGMDFGLYLDSASGDDTVVWRTPGGDHEFAARPPLRFSEADAIERLELTGERWVFFVDDRTGRGRVAYRRGDYRFGLLIPAC
jgi:Sigma 54 modulation/S30EA ribosomal protein C terminus